MERFDFSFSSDFLKSYRPIRLLGQGAMGSVHLMHHLRLDVPVAVKFIRSEGFSDVELARFEREARVLAVLNHPHIMSVLDMGMDGRNPYLVCEFVDGGSLADRVRRKPPLTPHQSLRIIGQLLSALRAAHQKGIVHRDIKPGNIFLTSSMKVKLGDFGLAKPLAAPAEDGPLTVTGAIIGTPTYMSPEQCRGLPATAASDLYAVGIVLFELVTGARPFPGPGMLEYLLQHAQQEPPRLHSLRPDLPSELDELVRRALEKKPELRPAGAQEFRREVLAISRAMGASTPDSARTLRGGRYRLERQVGEGWLGLVYQARDEQQGETVAVKTLRAATWRDADLQARIRRAAGYSQRLIHENIVRVRSLEEEDGTAFLVTDFVAGKSLEHELERRSTEGCGPLEAREALPLFASIVSALSHAHRAGCLHTGLRPSNVMLAEPVTAWRARVTDFGVDPRASAEATTTSSFASTAVEAYLSPEQRAGELLDERSDVYALAVLAQRVLTGFEDPTSSSGRLTAPLIELLARSRARAKQDRPASADEFLALYRAAIGEEEQTPKTVVLVPAAPKHRGSAMVSQTMPGAGGLVAAGAIGLLVLVGWGAQKLPGPPVTPTAPVSPGSIAVATSSPTAGAAIATPSATKTPVSPATPVAAVTAATPASPVDDTTALEVVLRSAGAGSAAAQYEAGIRYRDGRGTPKRVPEAIQWLRQAADQGHVRAQYELGALLEACGQASDAAEAGTRYLRAAENGHVKAQVKLGTLFLTGRGVLHDPSRAVAWFRKAAEAGDPVAQWNLAELFARGVDVPRDDVEALRWYRAAAAQGDPLGQCGVGLMYESGRGVAADPAEAFRWYTRAADAGHPVGLYHVGLCYYNGVGVAANERTAIAWLERAAERAHAPAELALGRIHAKDSSTPRHLEKAHGWMKRAAEHGDADAQFLVGMMYLEGAGTRADRTAATRWMEAAAKQGHAGARTWLEDNGATAR